MFHQRVERFACSLGAMIVALTSGLAATPGAEPNRRPDEKVVRDELGSLLVKLAASAERTTMGGRVGNAGESLPDITNLCRAARFLAVLPAAERYQRLKAWVLPAGPDARMRTAMCYAPVEFPPEFFFSDANLPERVGPAPGGDGVVCLVEMLLDAAVEAGTLPDLGTAAAAFAKRCEAADTLVSLVAFALDRDPDLADRAEQIVARWDGRAVAVAGSQSAPWPAYMLARAWMRGTRFRQQGERLAGLLAAFARTADQRALLSHLARDQAACRVRRCGGIPIVSEPRLALWKPGGYYFGRGVQAGTWPGWWAERDGMIVHWAGPEVSPLYFDYPLVGSFEFSAEAQCSDSGEAAVQYGRLVFEPFSKGARTQFSTIDQQTYLERPAVGGRGRFNELTIRVSPERISYLCNGVLVLEDQDPSPTTPWLALLGRATRTTAWRHLRITGSPKIPREVRLIQGDRMEGWMSPLYREALPRLDPPGGGRLTVDSRSAGHGCSWYVADDVLRGQRLKSSARAFPSQSCIMYHRPLRDGEIVSYDFFYQPGEKAVYPSLGRIVLLMEPSGVRLHWVTDVPHLAMGGLPPDNAVAVPGEQRAPRPLPLEPNQWNAMSIHMDNNRAVFRLNGTAIYERRLEPSDSRMFGLFHYRSETVPEVRNVVLKGNWPTSLAFDDLR